MRDKTIKIALGLSGGLDPSVPAALPKGKNYEVLRIPMETFEGPTPMDRAEGHASYGTNEKEVSKGLQRSVENLIPDFTR